MKFIHNLLILSHRYIGIPISFMFVLWFVSAFVMIYAGGMPRITGEMRVEAAKPLEIGAIRISPLEAESIAGFSPSAVNLTMSLGRPLYEFQEVGFPSSYIFADTGEKLRSLDEENAKRVASLFLDIPVNKFTFVEELNVADQWTISNTMDMPLLKFSADDDLGTEVYVSPQKSTVSIYTTSQSRLLAWLGTIPHWLYYTSLRLNQPLWYDVVVWVSALGCLMALLGLLLGFTQFRKVRPFKLSQAIPYQGWMRWHYITGVIFGLITLTWVSSGLLSMEPFAWTNARNLPVDRNVYAEGALDLAAFEALNKVNWETLIDGELKEIQYTWIQGKPYLLVHYSEKSLIAEKRERLHQPYNILGQAESSSLLIDGQSLTIKESFDVDDLVQKLDRSLPNTQVLEYELLSNYDNYYYSRNSNIPLPVLRVKLDDPLATWVYIDPQQSKLLTLVHKWSRLERWLYNGLHSLDFAFWYHQRPLWDIGVIILLLGGLFSSCTGVYFGLRRLKNDILFLIR